MKESKSLFARTRKPSLILLVTLLALALGATFVGEVYAKEELLAQMGKRFGGKASVEKLSLSLLGKLSIEQLRAEDAHGDPVLSITELHGSVGLASLLAGYPELDATLDGVELNLRQLPDESWNYATWVREDEQQPVADSRPQRAREELQRLAFFGDLKLRSGRVLLIANDGTTRIEELRATGGVKRDGTLFDMQLDANVLPSKALRASGTLQELLGLHAELSADLRRGASAAEWDFHMGVENGEGNLKLKGILSPLVLLGQMGTDQEPEQQHPEAIKIQLDASSIDLNAGLMLLLQRLHPVFASIPELESSRIAGLLDGSLQLSYRGSMQTDPDPIRRLGGVLQAISGAGNLSIAGARLDDAPLFEELRTFLGLQDRELSLSRFHFDIQNGRIDYLSGWDWKIAGVETSFKGSVGLDGSLDLAWKVPLTDGVLAKHSLLKSLKGKTIEIPIGGSLQAPVFHFQRALGSLGSEAFKEEALQRLGLDELPNLDDLGKLGLDRLGLGEQRVGAQDPGELFQEANRLWDAGQRSQASLLYQKLRSEHKTSLVYALNRSTIKTRAKAQD